MAERAVHLVDHVFPDVPVRQWVLMSAVSSALSTGVGPRSLPRRRRRLHARCAGMVARSGAPRDASFWEALYFR